MSRDEGLCWFHGKLSRESAEELLKIDDLEDGTFLVRESNTAIGDYVLSLLYQDEVCHYQIRRHGEDAFFSIDDKVKILHGLDTLVEFYQQASNGLITKLTKILRKDPPPNDSRSHGVTNLLHRATKENNQTVVSELLKCGYRNVDAKNQDGQTAMHLAALYSDETILQLLLQAGVNVNCMDTLGNMPLHYACRHKSASFVGILIAANANVQGRNIKNGYVPLHEAAKHGNLAVMKELIAAHAPHLPRTSYGEFPIDLAREAGQDEVVAFLESYKPPTPTTFKSHWYHGTLERSDAVDALMTFAAKRERNQQQQLQMQEDRNDNDEDNREQPPPPSLKDDSKDVGYKLITHADSSGCFLIRFSERKGAGSGYVLTLLFDNNAKNFLISQSSNYLYIDEGPFLSSLEHLVEHFMRFADGLPINLKYPVPPKPKPPLPLFSTMPRASTHKRSPDASIALATAKNNNSIPKDEQQIRKHSLDAQNIHNHDHLSEKHAQTLNFKPKKHKENSVFSTLRLRSPKKSSLMDSMNSLRKSKFKNKTAAAVCPETRSPNSATGADELKKAEPLLKNLSFSTDFSHLNLGEGETTPSQTPADAGFYNVPQNNASVADASSNNTSIEIERKTAEEVEYFTASDVAIERNRMTAALTNPPTFPTNPNGYIPTVDIRVFMDHDGPLPGGSSFSQELLEASAAELREFSNHPERLDTLISTTSSESSMMRYLNRQCSNSVPNTPTPTATTPENPEAATSSAQSKLNFFIPSEYLVLEHIIGEGEFGSVYKGCLILSANGGDTLTSPGMRRDVAIKTLRDEHCRTNKQEFLREASVMIRLKHHCIVQLLGISRGETLMMVQEIVPLGSMLNFILENKAKINPKYELKLWASQIACGMQYLESHHFVHRDLAARNILLASRNQAKISDFGLSRALGTGNECYQASQGGKWPIKWYAPESYNNGLFSHASDVWSFGVTLWEMFSLGEPPYGDIRGVEAIQLIESGQRLPQPKLCPEHVFDIMKNCWNYKPKDRPTFRYLTDFFAKDPDYQNIMELVKTEHIT